MPESHVVFAGAASSNHLVSCRCIRASFNIFLLSGEVGDQVGLFLGNIPISHQLLDSLDSRLVKLG